MAVVLVSASPNASEEAIQEVFDKHGLEREAPEVKEEKVAAAPPVEAVEPARDDFETDEEFEAARAEWKKAADAEAKVKEAEEDESEKKTNRFQRRVDKRVARETAALRQEADDLRRRLEELEGKKGAEGETKKAAEENPRPKRDAFDSQEKYEDALLAWGTKDAIAKKEAEDKAKAAKDATEAESKQLETNYQNYREQVEEFKEEHDDWDDVVNQDIPMHTAVQLALLEQPNGAEVTYYLGKHTDFTEKLAGMSPLSAVVEIGILSRKLQSETTRKPSGPATEWGGKTRTTTTPRAPAPVQPVRTGTTLSSMTSRDAAKANDYKAFKRAQRGGR
jgi:hypothetical protein